MTVDSSQASAENSDVWTVARIIDWTTSHLRQRGSETPRLEAEILLAHARKCKRIQLYTHYDAVLTDNERAVMRDLVRRRSQMEPVAYLVGYREFFGLDFKVTPAVLIPRPDTETLVVELLAQAKSHARPRVLDLCTGSGCIAIAAAVHLPHAWITSTDISPDALEIAQANATKHQVQDRITFVEGDLTAPLPAGEPFDFIVSNPPYIPEAEIAGLDADVRFEPKLALDGGPDGMQVVTRVIAESASLLKPGGLLLIEIGCEQGAVTEAAIAAQGDFEAVHILNDLAGRNRVVSARRI